MANATAGGASEGEGRANTGADDTWGVCAALVVTGVCGVAVFCRRRYEGGETTARADAGALPRPTDAACYWTLSVSFFDSWNPRDTYYTYKLWRNLTTLSSILSIRPYPDYGMLL